MNGKGRQVPRELRDMVQGLARAEKTVYEFRTAITEVLIEQKLIGYFKVDWSRLRRDLMID